MITKRTTLAVILAVTIILLTGCAGRNERLASPAQVIALKTDVIAVIQPLMVAQIRNEVTANFGFIRQDLERVKQRLESLEKTSFNMQLELSDIKNQVASHRRRQSNWTLQEIGELEDDLTTMQRELAAMRRQITHYESELRNVISQDQQQDAVIKTLRDRMDELGNPSKNREEGSSPARQRFKAPFAIFFVLKYSSGKLSDYSWITNIELALRKTGEKVVNGHYVYILEDSNFGVTYELPIPPYDEGIHYNIAVLIP